VSGSGDRHTSAVDEPPQYDEVCGDSNPATDSALPSYVDYIRSLGHVVVVVDITADRQTNAISSSSSSP